MILVNALVFGSLVIVVTSALISWGGTLLKSSKQLTDREQAFHIAEAGIDYYRWRLAHFPTDYTDGTGSTTGPYVHDFENKEGEVIGQFSLTITPPTVGSTVVTIRSEGTVLADPTIKRVIESRLAIPSFAKYAVVADDDMRFGAGTEVYGPVHSNGGIRFDGIAYNLVTSARTNYNDQDNSGGMRFGVYTTLSPEDPQPPSAVPSRPDVFVAGREFPVPEVDFAGITTDISTIKTLAQSGGRYFGSSGSQGYHIVLKTNDTFDLYRVNSLRSTSNNCSNQNQGQGGWSSWSINTQTFLQNYAIPANGLIFVEDHVWVDGQIDTARVTIASGRFPDSPGQRKNIIVNNDLLYTNYDGTDVIGLIAQGDINVGLWSEEDLRIDAALISQNGRVGRHYYNNNCGSSNSTKDLITLYGMIATADRYGFAYTDGTGYTDRDIVYDTNLLYSPPPSFPLTSDQYQTISWEEVK